MGQSQGPFAGQTPNSRLTRLLPPQWHFFPKMLLGVLYDIENRTGRCLRIETATAQCAGWLRQQLCQQRSKTL